MSINIVQIISNQLQGGTLNKLSSLIGESPERTQTAVGAAVPTLLAGLTHAASTPEGAQRLTSAISQQSDPNIESNFAGSLDKPQNPEAGSNLLGSLMGGGLGGQLSSILGQFTGMKSGAVGGLLGSIAPLVLGVIGKQQKVAGPEGSSVSGFLNSQKQNIAAAMPAGLGPLLGSIPGMGGFAQKLSAEPELAHAGASPSFSGASSGGGRSAPETRSAEPVREAASPARFLIPLLIIAALVWAFWSWTRHRNATSTTEPGITTEPAARTATATGATGLASGMRDTLNSATSTLSGITDANSAEQSLPQLNQLDDKLTGMKAQLDKLPASARPTVMAAIQPSAAKLQQLSAKVRGMPGVAEKIQPTLDKLDANLSSLTATQ